jgi:hypothetical protein
MKTKIIAISILAVIALLFSTATAFADPGMSLSFQASSGNSAGWVSGPGTGTSSEAYLTITNPAGFSFAVIAVHHFPSTLPTTSTPSFTSPQYATGTPRIYIQMNDGNYIFIFGDGTAESVCSSTCTSAYGSVSVVYPTFAAQESSATVSAVYIVADPSQPVPYTAYITCFQYAGVALIGPGGNCPQS